MNSRKYQARLKRAEAAAERTQFNSLPLEAQLDILSAEAEATGRIAQAQDPEAFEKRATELFNEAMKQMFGDGWNG